jgi:hypothetical protein
MAETLSLDMDQFEAEITEQPEITEVLGAMTVLDELGTIYQDLGQQEIATASGSGNTNGVDLDGE